MLTGKGVLYPGAMTRLLTGPAPNLGALLLEHITELHIVSQTVSDVLYHAKEARWPGYRRQQASGGADILTQNRYVDFGVVPRGQTLVAALWYFDLGTDLENVPLYRMMVGDAEFRTGSDGSTLLFGPIREPFVSDGGRLNVAVPALVAA